MKKRVNFFVNCFERDYREVLAPGFMKNKAEQFQYPFAKRIVTINNVIDRASALDLARKAVQRQEIDSFLEVARELPRALKTCGIQERELGKVRHYIDFALVAVTAAAPDFLLYCCAEVELSRPMDWISSAIEKMDSSSRFLVANPSWQSDPSGAERESICRNGDHWVGEGFSDQCFLADASRLAEKIYGFRHASGARYPLSDLGDIFEKRVDAYMRTHGLLRLTDSRVSYRHLGTEGAGYPTLPFFARLKRRIRSWIKSDGTPDNAATQNIDEGGMA